MGAWNQTNVNLGPFSSHSFLCPLLHSWLLALTSNSVLWVSSKQLCVDSVTVSHCDRVASHHLNVKVPGLCQSVSSPSAHHCYYLPLHIIYTLLRPRRALKTRTRRPFDVTLRRTTTPHSRFVPRAFAAVGLSCCFCCPLSPVHGFAACGFACAFCAVGFSLPRRTQCICVLVRPALSLTPTPISQTVQAI